jgi:ribosome-binding factor A
MANFRQQKVENEVKRLVGNIINNEVRDPSVPSMCSVISVKVAKDLKNAKVDISIMDSDADPKKAIDALNKASGFIRHRLGDIMSTRTVPALKFSYNNSIEHSIKINELLSSVKSDDE